MIIDKSDNIRIKEINLPLNKDNPLISIITVVFNGVKYIEQTILSVLNQSYKNIELIIIDGASVDGTLEIIKKYDSKLSYWHREPDNGIYDAMNKGISKVKSKDSYILFLNSDDYLYKNTSIESFVSKFEDEDFIYGKIMSANEATNVILGEELNANQLTVSMIQHQATFVKKKVFDELGLFNVKYKIAADFDFAIRVMKSSFSKKFIDEVVTVMRTGGTGSKNYRITFKEKSHIIAYQYKGYTKVKSLIYFNFYELPKFFILNFLKHIGLLQLLRKKKFHKRTCYNENGNM